MEAIGSNKQKSSIKVSSTKSKLANNQVLSKSSSSGASGSLHNGRSRTSNKSSSNVSSAMSLLGKLDMNQLKQTTFNYVNKASKVQQQNNKHQDAAEAASRRACIDYALELVISNLIINGQLDPTKAYQMRTPTMKTRIGTICDKILQHKRSQTRSTSRSSSRKRLPSADRSSSLATRSPSSINGKSGRSKSSTQKWAVQPTALPITIITDSALAQMALPKKKTTSPSPVAVGVKRKSSEKIGKKSGVLHFKSYDSSSSVEEARKLKPRNSKSKASVTSVRSNESKQKVMINKNKGLPNNKEANKVPVVAKTDEAVAAKALREQQPQRFHQEASSEVPSNFSIEGNHARITSSHSLTTSEKGFLKMPRNVQFESQNDPLTTSHDAPRALPTILSSENVISQGCAVSGVEERVDSDIFAAVRQAIFAPPTSAIPDSCPGTAKTLDSIISSNTSIAPSNQANLTGYQILIDMRGFLPEEIAMEVEGRQLIFFASRLKKAEVNTRKVTEIIDVPGTVNMENLKIGRKEDGFVVIEEYEVDQEQQQQNNDNE